MAPPLPRKYQRFPLSEMIARAGRMCVIATVGLPATRLADAKASLVWLIRVAASSAASTSASEAAPNPQDRGHRSDER
jgi:hypothetical protein